MREASKDEGFALICFGNDITYVFSESIVTPRSLDVINMSDMNIINDEISRLLMRSNSENVTLKTVGGIDGCLLVEPPALVLVFNYQTRQNAIYTAKLSKKRNDW